MICPNCQTENPPGAMACIRCGMTLTSIPTGPGANTSWAADVTSQGVSTGGPAASVGTPPDGSAGSQPLQPIYSAPPSQPVYPYPGQPYPGQPSQPIYPYQAQPSQPLYPYPGQPSQPAYPYPGQPSQPLYPYPYEGQPSQPYPQQALVPVPPTVITARPAPSGGLRGALLGGRSWLAGMPLWLALVAVVVSVGTLVVATLALQRDWADGAVFAAVAAIVMIVVVLGAGVTGLILRSARPLMVGLTGALLVVLAAASVGSLIDQPGLHALQAGSLEHDGQWQAAIHEYTLAGEQPPTAANIARVHLEWGEALLAQQNYKDATPLFVQAQSDDTGSADVTARSDRDLAQTYRVWIAADTRTFPYVDAITFFEAYQKSTACDAACQQNAHQLLAQILFTQGHDIVLPTNCSSALPIYQDLAANYADTTYGTQAAQALAAPVDVTITLDGTPAAVLAGSPVAYLSKVLQPLVLDQIQYFSDDYAAVLDHSGNLLFHGVKPGDYNLSVALPDGSRWYWRDTSPFNPYTETIQPLCGPTVPVFGW